MTANVVERVNGRGLIPRHDQTVAGNFRHKIIARPGELAGVSNQDPVPRENSFLLLSENLVGDEEFLGQSFQASGEGLDRFAKFWLHLSVRKIARTGLESKPTSGRGSAI